MRGSDTDNIALIFNVMLFYVAWTHRMLIFRVAVAVMLGVLVVILGKIIVHISKKATRGYEGSCSLETIDQMSGLEFERCVGQLLKKQGFSRVSFTERYDYGVDIVAEKDGIRWGIQVKRYSGLVKASAVRQVVTALRKYNCDRAMVVSNNYFSRVAAELARSNDCMLVDRSKLISWIA